MAAPQERARRRVAQLRLRGEIVDQADVLNSIMSRDRRDANRSVGPLAVPADATVIDSTHLSEPEVVDLIVSKVHSTVQDDRVATNRTHHSLQVLPGDMQNWHDHFI